MCILLNNGWQSLLQFFHCFNHILHILSIFGTKLIHAASVSFKSAKQVKSHFTDQLTDMLNRIKVTP